MLTNCLAACAHLTTGITVSEIERDICENSRRNIAIPFGVEKLKWWGYPMVKKLGGYV